jgi:hypothetical protein
MQQEKELKLDPKKGLYVEAGRESVDKREKIVLGPKWQNNSSRGAGDE